MGFFVASPSQEDLDERYEESLDSAGVRNVSVDGTSVSIDSDAEIKRIEQIEQRRAARTRAAVPISMFKAVSRGLQ